VSQDCQVLESQIYGNPTKKLSRDMYKEIESNLGKQLQQALNSLFGRFDYAVHFAASFYKWSIII